MARKPRDQLFRKSDVYRLIESAKAKGLPIARIDVTRDGLSLVVGEPVDNHENPWDEALSNAANEERTS